jgi:hypothetical protein
VVREAEGRRRCAGVGGGLRVQVDVRHGAAAGVAAVAEPFLVKCASFTMPP